MVYHFPSKNFRVLFFSVKFLIIFSNRNNISNFVEHFLKDLLQQINKKFLPNYFNHQINLLHPNENYHPWFDYINQCVNDRIYLSASSSLITLSNRSIIIEFLFHFIDQLYQTFRQKQSEFYLNDIILIDLHRKLSNENLLSEPKEIIENIQKNLTYHFETNAELVHICLNQIRKSQTSLIFHYTWTIFIQYLHTYYNVLWNT